MKIELTVEGAIALREFAEAMPFALENIVESTENLLQVYQSVAEELGNHEPEFCEMLLHIKKAQEDASEAIQVLPGQLLATADKIDAYVANRPTVN